MNGLACFPHQSSTQRGHARRPDAVPYETRHVATQVNTVTRLGGCEAHCAWDQESAAGRLCGARHLLALNVADASCVPGLVRIRRRNHDHLAGASFTGELCVSPIVHLFWFFIPTLPEQTRIADRAATAVQSGAMYAIYPTSSTLTQRQRRQRRHRRLVLSVNTVVSVVALLAALTSLGCVSGVNAAGELERTLDRGHSAIGTYLDDGQFRFAGRRLVVGLTDGRLSASTDWALVNVVDPSARPTLESKEGDAWVADLRFDVHGSGIDDVQVFVPRYDLLFRHRPTGASLVMRTHPISYWASSVALRAFADARIDADSSEIAYAIAQGTSAVVAVDATQRIAIARGGALVSVDHMEAYAFEYAIEDANRYELGLPQSPYRVRTLFIRPTWNWSIGSSSWPAIVEVTLSARDVDFDAVESALDDLIARLVLRPVERPDIDGGRRARAVLACFENAGLHPQNLELRRTQRGVFNAYVMNNTDPVVFETDSRLRACLTPLFPLATATVRSTPITYYFPPPSDQLEPNAYTSDVWNHLEVPRVTVPVSRPAPTTEAP